MKTLITAQEAKEVIENTKGSFFTVVFTKKDGSLRTMNCRTGVKRHLHGGTSTTQHIKKYITVFENSTRCYKNVNLTTLKEVHANGNIYRIKDTSKDETC